jgi:hypothetical protein
VHTAWRTHRDPAQVLDLLQDRLTSAADVTAVDRDGPMLVVRSRDVPMWAYLLALVLTPLPIKSALMRARTERELRITATGHSPDGAVELDGDANAAVSKVLVTTSHELFPDMAAAWDDE